jgi:hypothetical protein
MAWLRIGDDFVNLEHLGRIDFKELDTGIWAEFYAADGQLVFMIALTRDEAEKLQMALQYATKAVPVYIGALRQSPMKIETETQE